MLNPSATSRAEKTLHATTIEFAELLADIKKRSEEFEQQKYIPADIISRFKKIGVYRALVPKRYGGDEISPAEFCQLIETLSTADGSAGWVASFGMNPFYLGGLPPSSLDELYRHGPDIVFAGGIFPPQKATTQDGGYRVSGRWSFASGCSGAELIGVGILTDDGSDRPLPRIAVLPAGEFTIDPVWNTVGLSGTGSHDVVLNNAFVPQEWTFIRGGELNLALCIAIRYCRWPLRCCRWSHWVSPARRYRKFTPLPNARARSPARRAWRIANSRRWKSPTAKRICVRRAAGSTTPSTMSGKRFCAAMNREKSGLTPCASLPPTLPASLLRLPPAR